VSTALGGGGTIVTLRGECDYATRPALLEILTELIVAGDGPVVIDLAETTFIDGGSVRAVTRAADVLSDGGRPLTIRAPTRLARRVLAICEASHLVQPPLARASASPDVRANGGAAG
jgi:anti-anti-sigma factor